jgi:TRAP-type mannitol/chloroaromatic compound transport system substrate-binding protein|tara:strand:- start:1256 stop:2311 length:1056 start_codon:yes stop_codon:yes gene_type:complete
MKRGSLSGGAIAAALALGLGANAADAAERWSMATAWAGGPILEQAAKRAARNIEFLTDNEIKIEVFPGGTMGSPLKVTETVRKGVTEIGHSWSGYDWGIEKTAVLFAGYAGGLNAEQMFHWIYEAGGLELYQQFRLEKFGVIAFPCGALPREMGMHSRKRVQTLEDFKGLKLRTAGAWAEIAPGLGASTVILPGAEVYPALERGVIDAIEWAHLSINKTIGFHKIAKYLIMPGIHQPTAFIECTVNKKAWDSLSERTQKLLMAAGKLTTHKFYQEVGNADAYAYDFYVNSGNEIVVLDDEVIEKAQELSYAWADKVAAEEGGWFAKVLKIQRDYQMAWSNAYKYRDTLPPK